jgi:SET domain-containing protein
MKHDDGRNDIEIAKSPISGKGLFAKTLIKKDSVVLFWRPKVLSKQEADALPDEEKAHYLYPEGESMLWMQSPERYLNHSCEPNTYVVGQSDVALRDIKPGEEITSDYIDLETEKFECRCGSAKCRNPAGKSGPQSAS